MPLEQIFGKNQRTTVLPLGMKTRVALLLIALITGCAKDPRHDLQILNQYQVGATREHLVAQLQAQDAKLLQSQTRPAEGWPAPGKKSNRTEVAAFRFEQDHPGVTVQLSEEYWVWRRYAYTSAFSIPGVWYDYLLFDKDTNLLAYYRKFVD
jgi:hypothetical protein